MCFFILVDFGLDNYVRYQFKNNRRNIQAIRYEIDQVPSRKDKCIYKKISYSYLN